MKRHHNAIVREAIDTIIAAGYVPTIVINKHVKIYWHQNGHQNMLVCSVSPSDRATIWASRARLRRMLREGATRNDR
jgi:hypothetical protein